MLPEFFLIVIMALNTPQQQIGLLERVPTLGACNTKAKQLQELAPKEVNFGCITFTQPRII